VPLHDIGKNIPVFRQGKAFNGFETREGLKAEFGTIAEKGLLLCHTSQ
jgi:hypothetical protein